MVEKVISAFLVISSGILLNLVSSQTITSTLFDGKYACPGQEIIFTCQTNGSLTMLWNSDEYIERNGHQLDLSFKHPKNSDTCRSTTCTFAGVTMTKDGLQLVTESQLHITVSKDIAIANITCSDVSGLSSSVQFELLSVPATPQEVSAIKVTPPSEDDCIIIVNWNPPSNENTTLVKYYMVQSPSGNVTTINTKVSVIYHCDLESDAQIGIHAIDSCDRNGTSSDNIIADLLETTNNSSGNVTTEQPSTEIPTTGGEQYTCKCDAHKVGAVLGISLVLNVILSIILGIVLVKRTLKDRLQGDGGSGRIQADGALVDTSSSGSKDTTNKDMKLKQELSRSKEMDIRRRPLISKESNDKEM